MLSGRILIDLVLEREKALPKLWGRGNEGHTDSVRLITIRQFVFLNNRSFLRDPRWLLLSSPQQFRCTASIYHLTFSIVDLVLGKSLTAGIR